MKKPGKKSHRLLRLEAMLQSGADVRLPELAHRWNVSLRSLQRDLRDLQAAGVRLKASTDDTGHRVWRMDTSKNRFSVRLDTAELVITRLAVGVFGQSPGTGPQDYVSEVAAGVVRKLEAAAGPRLEGTGKFFARQPFARNFGVDAHVFSTVVSGLFEGRTLELEYAGLRGDARRHVLHPFSLIAYRGALHLAGRSESVRDGLPRVFAMDRILTCRVRRDAAVVPPDWDPESVIPFWGGLLPGRLQKITLRFSPSAQIQWRLPENCRVTAAPGQCVDLTLHADINDDFLEELISFGTAVRVVRPKTLQQLLTARLRAILSLYE